MADGTSIAPAPAAATGISPEQVVSQSVAGIKKDAAGEAAATQKAVGELDTLQQDTSKSVRSFDDIIAQLKPPDLQPSPTMDQVQQTNPIKAWTSSAMLLAAIGSLFTRRPLTAAMSSAAQALNAFRAGDQAAANAAFAKWKIDTDNYWKVQNYQQETYKEVLGAYMDRQRINLDLGNQEQANKIAELNAIGHSYGDDMMANVHSLDAALRVIEERDRVAEMMTMSGGKIMEAQSTQAAMTEWEGKFKKDNGREPTAEERLEHLGEVRQQIGHQWNDQEVNAAVNNANSRAAAYAKNSGYQGAVSNVQGILSFNLDQLPHRGEVIEQAQALDKFIQTINGNRAIRGFQLKLIQDDAGIYNNFQRAMQQLGQGGAVTRPMIAEMQKLASDYIHVATLNYGEYITKSQWQHWKLGLDPTLFVPPDYQPDKDPQRGVYPAPPDAAIKALREKPTGDNWVAFDQVFGQGAAANVFAADQGQ